MHDQDDTPSLLRQAAGLATAVVRHVANGCEMTSHEVQAERLAICQACPHYEATADRCALCGCRGIKRAMPREACPEGRWKAVD